MKKIINKLIFCDIFLAIIIVFLSICNKMDFFSIENKNYKSNNIELRNETGFKIENGYLTGVEPNRVAELLDLGLEENYKTKVINNNKIEKKKEYVSTGDKIEIYLNNSKIVEYTIIINGDTSGDGKVNYLDYVNIYNHIKKIKNPESNKKKLENEYALSADINKDNKINYLDYVMVYKEIKGRSSTKYTITYNKNTGNGSMPIDSATKDTTTNLTRNKFTKEGYKFVSWNTSSNGSGTKYYDVSKILLTKNITLYAQWEANKYTVSFNRNCPTTGQGGQTSSVTATYDLAMPSIATTAPSCSGYTFQGWYDTSASVGGTQYYTATGASARTYNKTANTTLYARWENSSKPICVFGTVSGPMYTTTTTVTLTCTDNDGMNSQTLNANNFTTSNSNIVTITNVSSPRAITGGYEYTVTLRATGVGTYMVDLNAASISDIDGNKNEKVTLNGTSISKPTTASIGTCTSRVYNGKKDAECTIVLNGIETKDTVTASGTCTFDNKNVATGKTVTCSSIILSGTDKNNYSLSSTTASKSSVANITPKDVTPSLSCQNKEYDGNTSATCTVTLNGIINGDTVTSSKTCTFDNKNVGTGKTVTCSSIALSGTDKNNYNLTASSKTATANITKKDLVITAKAQTINYGGSITTGTNQVTVATLVQGDTLTNITLTPSTSNATENGTITPSAAVIKDQDDNAMTNNYSITYNTGKLVINKRLLIAPTVTINSEGKVSWNNIEGASSYQVSFDNVNYVTAVSGEVGIPLTNPGTVTAYVKAIPDNNHYVAENIYGSASVNVYSLTISKDEGTSITNGSGNYISGSEISISSETLSGYKFKKWEITNGNTPVDVNSSTTKIVLTQNTSLVAKSDKYKLYIMYYSDGGTWNPSNDNYTFNSTDGYVHYSNNNEKYADSFDFDKTNINLVDYNGVWFNWRKSNAGVPPEEEYFILNESTNKKTYLNQSKEYEAVYLANASGCNLLNSNCTIVVKVNWEDYLITDSDYLKTSGTKFVKTSNNNGIVLRGFNIGEWLSRAISLSPIENVFKNIDTSSFPAPYTGLDSAYWREYPDNDIQINYVLNKRFGKEGEYALNDAYFKNFIRESDIEEMKQIGINLVRVPVGWSYFVDLTYNEPSQPIVPSAENPNPIDMNSYTYSYTMLSGDTLNKRLKYLDWIVHECRKRGIYVIFDLHVVDGGQNDGGIRSKRGHYSFFKSESINAQKNAIDIWKIIAKRFNGNPGVAGYELLNEPSSGYTQANPEGYRKELINFYDRAYKSIRDIDPNHIIMMESAMTSAYVHQVYTEDVNGTPLVTLPTESERTNGIFDQTICPSTNCKWTNVAYSLHDYFKSTNVNDIKNEIKEKVKKDVDDMKKYNVPIYIGEANFTYTTGDTLDDEITNDIWPYALNQYDNNLFSYTFWSYKVAKSSKYGMVYNLKYSYKNQSMGLLLTDSYNTILNKWSMTVDEAQYDYASIYTDILKNDFINKSNKPLIASSSYSCSAGATLTSTIKIFSRDGNTLINSVSSSDPSIAEVSFVDPTGVICTSTSCKTISIKCKTQGTVTLTATASNGEKSTSSISVNN